MRTSQIVILAAALCCAPLIACQGGPGTSEPDMAGANQGQPLRWSKQTTTTGFSLWSVWGSGPDDVYSVGYRGSVMHSTDRGQSWQVSMMGSLATLESVWGSGPDDVYAVGGDLIFHSTDRGKSWQKYEAPALFDLLGVGGSGADDVYVVTSKGNIFRSGDRGKTWPPRTSGFDKALTAVWARGAQEVYAVGLGGTILQSTDGGQRWAARPSGTQRDLFAVWGSGTRDLFVSGNFIPGANPEPGPVLRSQDNGATFSLVTSLAGNVLSGIWSADPFVFVVGDHGRFLQSSDGGATFQGEPLEGKLNAVWASGPRDVYVVGDGGVIFHGQ